MPRAVSILTLPVLFLVACEPAPTTPPGPTEAERAELAEISAKLDRIAEPVASDPETLTRARKDLAAVAGAYGTWLAARSKSIESCEMDCLGSWLLCATEDGGGIQPMSAPVPQGEAGPDGEGAANDAEAAAEIEEDGDLRHRPADWIDYCDWKFQKCMMRCHIALDLKP